MSRGDTTLCSCARGVFLAAREAKISLPSPHLLIAGGSADKNTGHVKLKPDNV